MRKGMAYGRMREIDRMSKAEFAALPLDEKLLWWRTEMPPAQRMRIIREIDERLSSLRQR